MKTIQTLEDIIKILQSNVRVEDWVINARQKHIELNALVNGVKFDDLLIRIEHKEDTEKQKARKRYARSIIDTYTRLLRPLDNIYSATGGSKKYDMSNKNLIKKIASIRDGKTLEKWLQMNWMSLYHTDPNGVIMYEWTKDDFYPTYKCISNIRNYESDGQKLKWIMFEPENKMGQSYVRFINADADYLFLMSGDSFKLIEDKTYPNPFGSCPGIIISDIPILGSKLRETPIKPIVEISKEYLRDQSIKTIFKFLHGFPIFWRYAVQCDRCGGLGKIEQEGSEVKGTCPDCDGLGFYMKKDITDAVTLPVPTTNDDVKVAPDIAGFVNPPIDIWKQFNDELKFLELAMYETHWGSYIEKGNNETATGRWIDTQPVINKLNVYADVAEWVEWYLTELAYSFFSGNQKDKICTVLYGRNYIIDSPFVIIEKYEKAKEKGDNTAILDKLLSEWLYSKYKTDPETLNNELKRLQIEPFIHYSAKEIKEIYGEVEAKNKMLFQNWWVSADKSKEVKALKAEFEKYCSDKLKLNTN